MTTTPNQYTYQDGTANRGLHKFKDGVLYCCVQHSSGDWQTMGHPTAEQVKFFEQYGVKTPLPEKPKEVPQDALPDQN